MGFSYDLYLMRKSELQQKKRELRNQYNIEWAMKGIIEEPKTPEEKHNQLLVGIEIPFFTISTLLRRNEEFIKFKNEAELKIKNLEEERDSYLESIRLLKEDLKCHNDERQTMNEIMGDLETKVDHLKKDNSNLTKNIRNIKTRLNNRIIQRKQLLSVEPVILQ